MDLNEKVALVTGGTRGIGAATGLALARRGCDVAIVGRSEDEETKEARASIEATGRRCLMVAADVSRSEDCRRCVEETKQALGAVDVVVHSAGGPVPGGLFEISAEDWTQAFDVHVHAVFHLARAAVPEMRQRGAGSIILISSSAGIRALPTNIAYQAVKGTLPQLTRALGRELAGDNIRVNCVAPGVIRTRFHDAMTEEQKRINLEQRIPLRREGCSGDVANLIVELVANEYMTGETVVIDGGLTMRIA